MGVDSWAEFDRLQRDFGWQIADYGRLDEGVWTSPLSPPESSFEGDEHDLLAAVEDRSPWFTWRNRAIAQMLARAGMPHTLWEIGAGNGVVARHLERLGLETVAVEPGDAGCRTARRRGVSHVVRARLEDLTLPDGSIEAVGAFDVIEHFEDPTVLLGEVQRVLRPSGLFLVTVPAFGVLWSQADIHAGHFRRYTRRSLGAELKGAGFRLEHAAYLFAPMVAPLAVARSLPYRMGRRQTKGVAQAAFARQLEGGGSGRLNSVWRVAMRAELAWSRRLPVPLGTSVIAAARRL